MAENAENQNQNVESGADETSSGVDYIQAIQQLQANTVSKTDYAKLQDENKKLLQSLIKGEKIEQPKVPGDDVDPKEVVKHMVDNLETGSTMQGIEDILKLVDYDKAHGLPHPFLSMNNKNPDEDDIARAERVEQYFRDCLEYADGDKYLFAQELTRNMEDSPYVKTKK